MTNPRTIRARLGLTQSQFGSLLGLHGDPGRTVRGWEAGKEPSKPLQLLLRAVNRFGIDWIKD